MTEGLTAAEIGAVEKDAALRIGEIADEILTWVTGAQPPTDDITAIRFALAAERMMVAVELLTAAQDIITGAEEGGASHGALRD